MATTKEAHLKWGIVGEVLIGYGTAGKVADRQWLEWVEALKTPAVTCVLNVADGSADVNSVQRAKGNEVIKERNLVVAVVTDEILLRGMVTAASWFVGNSIKAFSSRQLRDAISFLGASKNEDQIIATVETLRSSTQPEA